ncbi:hypothetical protein OBBRIDRAFT_835926 [Obba rivulosa]|uniref:Uncharacterized protein n=1 Tax=Obba rivulosa TaxID=1052685 RepID=A0A8E2DN99_9APHY|nr:hypothetical protein OBBRIDRAFT_835926 [Obba rivulosa]
MEFCSHIFGPTDEAMHASVVARLDPALTSPSGPILLGDAVDKLIGEDDVEGRLVLRKLNARKPIHNMYNPADDFATEVLHGFRAVLEKGFVTLTAA